MARTETYPHEIFADLIQDHDRHRDLIAQIEATEGESPDRKRLFEELTKEIKGHAAAEEQALWSTILRKPQTTDEARHAVAEHKEIEDLFNQLAATDMSTGGWLNRFHKLKEEYLHHIEEEEEEIFPASAKVLTQEDRRWMASVFEKRKPIEKGKAEVTPKEEPDTDARADEAVKRRRQEHHEPHGRRSGGSNQNRATHDVKDRAPA